MNVRATNLGTMQIRRRSPRATARFCRRRRAACLLIVAAIIGSMLQSAIRARRQLHTERDRRQTELLLAGRRRPRAGPLGCRPDVPRRRLGAAGRRDRRPRRRAE